MFGFTFVVGMCLSDSLVSFNTVSKCVRLFLQLLCLRKTAEDKLKVAQLADLAVCLTEMGTQLAASQNLCSATLVAIDAMTTAAVQELKAKRSSKRKQGGDACERALSQLIQDQQLTALHAKLLEVCNLFDVKDGKD